MYGRVNTTVGTLTVSRSEYRRQLSRFFPNTSRYANPFLLDTL